MYNITHAPARLLSKAGATIVKRALREKWAIGIVKAPIHSFLDPCFVPDVQWISGGGRFDFLADGFGVVDGDMRFIIAERFTHRGWSMIASKGTRRPVRTGRGHITSITIDEEGRYVEEAVALDSGMHMSYPYTISDRDEWYCVAEEVSRDALGLYRKASDGQWRHVKDILRHAVVDPTIVYYANRWWLFGASPEQPNSSLMIWYADSLEGAWSAHAGNPVRTNRTDVRPGGTPFVRDGQLFRPSQNCTRSYGGSILINRVDSLSTHAYCEAPVRELSAAATWKYHDGIHTLSSFGEWTLIDGKSYVFLPSVVIRANLFRLVSPSKLLASEGIVLTAPADDTISTLGASTTAHPNGAGCHTTPVIGVARR